MDQTCEANAGNVAGAAEDAVEVPDRLCSDDVVSEFLHTQPVLNLRLWVDLIEKSLYPPVSSSGPLSLRVMNTHSSILLRKTVNPLSAIFQAFLFDKLTFP